MARQEWRPFEAAREFARALGLRWRREWFAWWKGDRPDLPRRPRDIPRDVARIYRDRGFTTWADFLGVPERARRGPRQAPAT